MSEVGKARGEMVLGSGGGEEGYKLTKTWDGLTMGCWGGGGVSDEAW